MLSHPMREVTAIGEEIRVRTLIPDRLRIMVMNVFLYRLTDPLNRPRFPIPLDRPKICGVNLIRNSEDEHYSRDASGFGK
jgi:hypothetical protein